MFCCVREFYIPTEFTIYFYRVSLEKITTTLSCIFSPRTDSHLELEKISTGSRQIATLIMRNSAVNRE